MTVQLHCVTEDPRVVHKNVDTEHPLFSITINNTDIKDILNPTIIINKNDEISSNINYAYISDFHRYYFITDISSNGAKNLQLELHVDVLKTYEEDIPNIYGILTRSSKATAEMVDKQLPINEYRKELGIYPITTPVVALNNDLSDPQILLFAT